MGDELFASAELFVALIRCREEQPRRYERETSPRTRRRVELYEEQKGRASGRAVAEGKAAA